MFSNEPRSAGPIEQDSKMSPVSQCHRLCGAFNQFSFSFFVRIERNLANSVLNSEPIYKFKNLGILKNLNIPANGIFLPGKLNSF